MTIESNDLLAPAAASIADPDPDAGFEALHPNARWLKRLSAAVLATVLLGVPAVAGSILASARFAIDLGVWLLLLPLLVLPLAIALGVAYANRRFARTRFRLDADGLEIRDGVWWRRATRVARSRVQHTDINRGPLDRRLGLATLKVYTAGTRLASIDLDGLPAARAVELRDALLDGHDDVL
jgi:uncharacterized protein